MNQFKEQNLIYRVPFKASKIIISIFLISIFNFSCSTLLPIEKRVYSEIIETNKKTESWKILMDNWVNKRFGERGLSTRTEDNNELVYVLGMGYTPDSVLPSVGNCHFVLHAAHTENSITLRYENIFYVNGYGNSGSRTHSHVGESGPNNSKDLDAIINRCMNVVTNDLKDFLKK